MNTRHASDDSVFRQERFMSSPEMQRGLLANCVAARVSALADPLHRKLIWWLQHESWQPGGLDKLAAEIMERWPERFVTPSMKRIGFDDGQIYNADEVRQVRAEISKTPNGCLGWRAEEFALKGEYRSFARQIAMMATFDPARALEMEREQESLMEEYQSEPDSYPAAVFVTKCRAAAEEDFSKFLFERLCLDPAVKLAPSPLWYLPSLGETLTELHDLQAAKAAGRAPVTQIGAKVHDDLDYALTARGSIVVIDGVARTGKTFAGKQWCDARPGQARYVQVPSSNDDLSFFRAICEALGLGASRAYKALDLRAKIEDVLQTGDLLLVLDEGHHLFPQRNMRLAVPHRINWVRTQLVNMDVPVAVLTTPQFTKSQEQLVRNGGWSSEQLIGRIGQYTQLPDALDEKDLEAVAKHWLPSGNAKTIRLLITYAQSSEKYLQGIESLVCRARFQSAKAGRSEPRFEDVAAALKGGVVPSDNALAAALAGARPPARRKAAGIAATAVVQSVCTPPARAVQAAQDSIFTLPVRDTGDSVLST
jgi:hypothetical protein